MDSLPTKARDAALWKDVPSALSSTWIIDWSNVHQIEQCMFSCNFQLLTSQTHLLAMCKFPFSLPLRLGMSVDETIIFGTSVLPPYGTLIIKEGNTRTIHVTSREDGVAERILDILKTMPSSMWSEFEFVPLAPADFPNYTSGHSPMLWNHVDATMQTFLPET